MPDDTKRNVKHKNEAKDQRKTKPEKPHSKNKSNSRRKGSESSQSEVDKDCTFNKQPEKQVPKFINASLDTTEVLNITEGIKYRKKEIESNWSKYEIQVESYEDVEAQKLSGSDFDELSKAPLNSGGHFQFKHEKSWDDTGTNTEFDKYFEVNCGHLSVALNTIPFHIRNDIDISIFNQNSIRNMNHRSTKYKPKYYGKSYKSECKDEHLEKQETNEDKKTTSSVLNTTPTLSTKQTDHTLPSLEAPASHTTQTRKEPSQILGQPTKTHVQSYNITQKETDQKLTHSPEELENWLDDFLES